MLLIDEMLAFPGAVDPPGARCYCDCSCWREMISDESNRDLMYQLRYDHLKDSVELCQRFGRARQEDSDTSTEVLISTNIKAMASYLLDC